MTKGRSRREGTSTTVDPFTAEVVRYKLEGIANEMCTTMLRSAFSPIVKEGRDASASLFTPRSRARRASSSKRKSFAANLSSLRGKLFRPLSTGLPPGRTG